MPPLSLLLLALLTASPTVKVEERPRVREEDSGAKAWSLWCPPCSVEVELSQVPAQGKSSCDDSQVLSIQEKGYGELLRFLLRSEGARFPAIQVVCGADSIMLKRGKGQAVSFPIHSGSTAGLEREVAQLEQRRAGKAWGQRVGELSALWPQVESDSPLGKLKTRVDLLLAEDALGRGLWEQATALLRPFKNDPGAVQLMTRLEAQRRRSAPFTVRRLRSAGVHFMDGTLWWEGDQACWLDHGEGRVEPHCLAPGGSEQGTGAGHVPLDRAQALASFRASALEAQAVRCGDDPVAQLGDQRLLVDSGAGLFILGKGLRAPITPQAALMLLPLGAGGRLLRSGYRLEGGWIWKVGQPERRWHLPAPPPSALELDPERVARQPRWCDAVVSPDLRTVAALLCRCEGASPEASCDRELHFGELLPQRSQR